MSGYDDDDLLRHARSGMTPGDEARRKMRQRLMSSVAAVGAASAASTAAASTASTAAAGSVATGTAATAGLGSGLGSGLGLGAKLLVVALGLSAMGGIGYVVGTSGPPSPEAAPSPATAPPVRPTPPASPPTSAASEAVVEVSPRVEVTPVVSERPAPSAARSRVRRAEPVLTEPVPTEPVPAARVEGSDLAEESALIRRARVALQRDEVGRSLRILGDHAARFPNGVLAEERDVQRVRAWCMSGDTARAVQLAARFVRAHPGSMHVDAMRTPCGASDPAQE